MPQEPRITLPDVARLAGVQRPVVTMWRKRSAGTDLPFPDSVASRHGAELFDGANVIDWLEATGRGKNREARADLAAFTAIGTESSAASFDALTALLCLKVVTGAALGTLDADAVIDLADDADPDDELAFREVEGARDELAELAAYVDRLADAAYSPAAAFEKLMSERFRRQLTGHAQVALTADARHMMARLAHALAAQVAAVAPTFADPTPGGSDLLVAALAESESVQPLTVLTPNVDDPASRLTRRRLLVHSAARRGFALSDDGEFALTDKVVLMAQYPCVTLPEMTGPELLSRVDNIALQMDDDQRAIVIGPASVLEARLASGQGDDVRADILRSGRVRAIVRLPLGLLTSKSRQPQALWVLGPAHADVPIRDRWTTVADLSGVDLGAPGVIDDLVLDVVAAMGDQRTVRSHAFRFGRLVLTRSLLAADRDLARAPISTAGLPTFGAEAMLRLATLLQIEPPEHWKPLNTDLAIAPREETTTPGLTRLDTLVDDGLVKVLSGARIDPEDVDDASEVRVIGPAEVFAGRVGNRRIDRGVFSTRYPRARYTEPGDVVFCSAGGVGAMVDADGFSAVAYPARILRIAPGAPLVPQLVAADINAQPAAVRSWRRWLVRRVPADQRDALSVGLAEVDRRRAALAYRLTELDDIADLLAHGVASGSLRLDHPAPLDHAAPLDHEMNDPRGL